MRKVTSFRFTWWVAVLGITASGCFLAVGEDVDGGTGGGLGGGTGGGLGGGLGGGAGSVPQIVPCAAIDPAFGTPVSLTSPTATFSQTSYGPFTIEKAIDGFLSNFGWAVDPQVSCAQTAAFATTADTIAQPTGTRLLFALNHTLYSDHALCRFRLSVTTASRTQFADGNRGAISPGNVGADALWTVLRPRRLCASNTPPLTVLNDDSILAGDINSTDVRYLVEADTALSGITGVRLEAMTDTSLPFSGPGCNSTNGNFVLVEFTVRTGSTN